jgi:Rad52/22 family double-strand break repair protein
MNDPIQQALAAPFPAAEVKFLPKAIQDNRALALPYLDARAIMDRLDEVLGVEGWWDHYEVLPNGSAICRLTLCCKEMPITKMDVGSPSEQPDKGDQVKAALSDALKRAAVKFGIGRYLYRIPSIWADYDPKKRAFVRPPQLPKEALPQGGLKPVLLPKGPPVSPIELVCHAEFEELQRLILETHTPPQDFINWASKTLGYQVEDVNFLPTSFFNTARSALLRKQAKQAG